MSRPSNIHPDDTFRLELDWGPWLRGQSISSVSYDPSHDNVSVSDTGVAGEISTGYVSCPELSVDDEFTIDITCTTTATVARVKTVTKTFRVVETRI